MSLEAYTRCWKYSEARGTRRLVLIALADYADEDEFFAWPSNRTLARKAKVSIKTVQRCLGWLIENGEIEAVDKTTRGVIKYCLIVAKYCGPRIRSDENADLDDGSDADFEVDFEGATSVNMTEVSDPTSVNLTEVKNPTSVNVTEVKNPTSVNVTGGVGQSDRSPKTQLTDKPLINRKVNPSPLNPPKGEGRSDLDEAFRRLVALHPGSHLGNFNRARETFEALCRSGIRSAWLIEAANAYDDQVEARDLKPCALSRWLKEDRYLAHAPTADRIADLGGDVETVEVEADPVEVDPGSQSAVRRFWDNLAAAGVDMTFYGALYFVDVADHTATIEAPSAFVIDQVKAHSRYETVILDCLASAGVHARAIRFVLEG